MVAFLAVLNGLLHAFNTIRAQERDARRFRKMIRGVSPAHTGPKEVQASAQL